eukprot:26983_1
MTLMYVHFQHLCIFLIIVSAICCKSIANSSSICGHIQSSSFDHTGIQRNYLYYFPSMLCNVSAFGSFMMKHTNRLTFDPLHDNITIPILLTIHGLGEPPSLHLLRWEWQTYAEQYGFILIAPQGNYGKASWNAQSCCDRSIEDNTDDVGFIRELLLQFIDDINTIFPFTNITTSNIILFITGHSNGGFLADKIAWIYAAGAFPIPITAVAPMSGYIYDNQRYLSEENHVNRNKMSIFYHHGGADPNVNLHGCGCPNVRCCCGIAEHASMCVTLQQAYARWIQWNHDETLQMDTKVVHVADQSPCNVSRIHDIYLVSMCIWNGAGHNLWGDTHIDKQRLRSIVIDFFMETLCIKQNKKWNDVNKSCECNQDNHHKKIYYCIEDEMMYTNDPTSSPFMTMDKTNEASTQNTEPRKWIEQQNRVNEHWFVQNGSNMLTVEVILVIATFVFGAAAFCMASLATVRSKKDSKQYLFVLE